MSFPGAVADQADAEYAVLGAPLDASTSFEPGARFGPRRVRQFAEPFDDFDHRTDQHFTNLRVTDHGDVGPTADVAEFLEYLRGTIGDYVAGDTLPLVVGGEHTVSVAGVRATEPDVYVCLDAHLDLREAYAGDPLSHATVCRHALDVADRAVVLGARTGSEAEWERAAEADVTVVAPADVAEWEPSLDGERAYLSVDVDAVDPGYAPGTGTMEPFGLTPRTIHDVVRSVAPHAVGFDVVEINDRDRGETATLGAKLLRAFVFANADGV